MKKNNYILYISIACLGFSIGGLLANLTLNPIFYHKFDFSNSFAFFSNSAIWAFLTVKFWNKK